MDDIQISARALRSGTMDNALAAVGGTRGYAVTTDPILEATTP